MPPPRGNPGSATGMSVEMTQCLSGKVTDLESMVLSHCTNLHSEVTDPGFP